ncbi:MAG: hypothetical protein R3F42_12685 [Pseudomonadota bacterium]
MLVQQVDAGQALKESNEHRRFLVMTLSLLLLCVAAISVAAWRHGSSVARSSRRTNFVARHSGCRSRPSCCMP